MSIIFSKYFKLLYLISFIFVFIALVLLSHTKPNNEINKFSTSILASDMQKKSFKIFDANNYQSAPDLRKYGLNNIEIIYEDRLTTHSDIYNKNSIRNMDVKKFTEEIHKLWNKNYTSPLVLDIETWNIEKHLDKYLYAYDIFKKMYGKSNVGYFSHSANHPELIKRSSVIYPAFYNTSYNNDEWENNVIKTINKIKKYNNSASVYAFICPQYLVNDRKAVQFINYSQWYKQLEFLYKYCDGVIIWGMPYYWDDKNNNKVVFFKWDENREWWKATKDFIKNYNIK